MLQLTTESIDAQWYHPELKPTLSGRARFTADTLEDVLAAFNDNTQIEVYADFHDVTYAIGAIIVGFRYQGVVEWRSTDFEVFER